MGEAKWRREHPPVSKNVFTGELVQIRKAGMTVTEYMEDLTEAHLGGRATMSVPCGECRECCWYNRVEIIKDQENPEDLEYFAMDHDGLGYFLRKRPDGGCIHLAGYGCSIYEHRPRACRGYDCRLGSIAGVVQTYEGGHRQPVWEFKLETQRDRATLLAVRIGLIPFMSRERLGYLNCDVTEALHQAGVNFQKNYMIAWKMVTEFDRMPKDVQEKLTRELEEQVWPPEREEG